MDREGKIREDTNLIEIDWAHRAKDVEYFQNFPNARPERTSIPFLDGQHRTTALCSTLVALFV